VTDVKRKSGARTIILEDGYSFDPYGNGPGSPHLRNMEIHRPMPKFRPSAFVPQTAKHDPDESVPIKRDETKKNRSRRKQAGSRK
jgi:hypothetical protein